MSGIPAEEFSVKEEHDTETETEKEKRKRKGQ